jgi:dihydrodipicolinate synthase/N-acetylneuraminate lyase
VHHGLVDPLGGSRELDDALDAARAAERDGADAVVVPASRHWPATAQALAVMLATTRIQVIVGVSAADADPAALARFAASAVRLAGDRLVLQVVGERAAITAERIRRRWDGPVMVGDTGLVTVA